MGFNYHNQGNIRECCIENGLIKTKDPFGRIREYETAFMENVPWQRHIFMNGYIAFLLYTVDGREVIGRMDGSITVYQGDLMVGLSSWKNSEGLMLSHVGYFHGPTNVRRIWCDVSDGRTLYVEGDRYESLLEDRVPHNVDLTSALAIVERGEMEACIVTRGGVKIEIPVWSIQDKLRIGACRSFV